MREGGGSPAGCAGSVATGGCPGSVGAEGCVDPVAAGGCADSVAAGGCADSTPAAGRAGCAASAGNSCAPAHSTTDPSPASSRNDAASPCRGLPKLRRAANTVPCNMAPILLSLAQNAIGVQPASAPARSRLALQRRKRDATAPTSTAVPSSSTAPAFRGRPSFNGDHVSATRKGVHLPERPNQVATMAQMQDMIDFPPAP